MITKRFLLNEILFLESMWNTLILKKTQNGFLWKLPLTDFSKKGYGKLQLTGSTKI